MVEQWEATAATVRVYEIPPVAMTALRLRKPSSTDLHRIGDLLGVPLPTTPNQVTDGAIRVIWIGPDEWLLLGDTPAHNAIEAAASDAVAALAVAVGDGRCSFEVTGPCAADLVAKGSSIDLMREVASAANSAMTLFGQVNAIIDRSAGGDGYRLIFDIGVRHYLHCWFRDAVVEFG